MVYKCSVCGYVFDEGAEGKAFSQLKECPLCKQPMDKFVLVSSEGENGAAVDENDENSDLAYPKETSERFAHAQ
ncbi:hypothetical protein AALB16_10175 [Lachnospiraceae bacterium 62-35]